MGTIRDTEREKLTRRSFVTLAAAATATLAGTSLTGCANQVTDNGTEPTGAKVYRTDTELMEDSDGKWIPVACEWNCGGNCLIKAYVVDGIAIRVKTDDSHPDSIETPQIRACLRGRAQSQQCFGADRLKYPMKRKNWEPLTGGDKSLRGRDEWVRISWDEAIELTAAEIKHAVENYGNRSILGGGAELAKFTTLIGGTVSVSDMASFGTTGFTATRIGLPSFWTKECNDRLDLPNADTIILYGSNPGWASAGNQCWYLSSAKDAGTQFVYVGPEYNVSAALFNARWIRVRPGSDIAFLMAVAYQMFKNDEANGNVIDWEFLDKYTVGINGDSMPDNAKLDENFYDYVMGAYDNIPKTPEWATEICGTPIEDIQWYAELMAKDNVVSTLYSYAPARCHNSEDWLQILMTVGWMGGHIGKPGHTTGPGYHAKCGNGGSDLNVYGDDGLPVLGGYLSEDGTVDDVINANKVWEAILTGKYNCTGLALGDVYMPEDIRDIDIRVILYHGTGAFNTWSGCNEAVEAHRKVDFVFSTGWSLSSQARYADIVLPISTFWDKPGDMRQPVMGNGGDRHREVLTMYQQVCEPLFESRTPMQMVSDLLEAYGIPADVAYPISATQQYYNRIAGSTVINEEGTDFGPLVTITQENIDAWGVEGEPQEGIVEFEKILEDGVHVVSRKEGDNYGYLGFQDYVNDPVKNPRSTPSGRFEIYSQDKADTVNALGYSTEYTWKPYPTYMPPLDGYEASFSDWENKVKGEYPIQVFNPHYLRRQHTQSDMLPYLREAFVNPVFVSAQDAAERGIQQGDTVRVWSKYGQFIRPVSISERFMPGVMGVPHGAWFEYDEELGLDKAGTDNGLRGQVTCGSGVSGYNTLLVNFEKYQGTPLDPDDQWPPRIVEFVEE